MVGALKLWKASGSSRAGVISEMEKNEMKDYGEIIDDYERDDLCKTEKSS